MLVCRPVTSRKTLTANQSPFFIGGMKTRIIGLTLAFCFLVTTMCFAADPQMGTWKLNEAKSTFTPGTGKNTTVVYKAASGGQVKITADGVDANGKPTHSEWTGKFDGKDYPVAGDPTSDMRSYTKRDDRTLNFTVKKRGKVTVKGRVVVEADGKSRTVMTSGRTGFGTATSRAVQRGDFLAEAKGQKYTNIAVFDKK
jgi:hypothetical protein